MELAIDDPIKRAQLMAGQVTGGQTQPSAPLSSNPSLGQEMGSMVKQRAMNTALNKGQEGIMSAFTPAAPISAGATNAAALAANPATMGMGGAEVALAGQALAPSVAGGAAGAGAMTALGTAMPYVGAGILAGKALGFFNEGGTVGPLSPQYNAEGGMPEGYNYQRPRYSPSQGIDESSLRAMQDAEAIEEQQIREAYERLFMGAVSLEGGGFSAGGPISAQYKAEGGNTMSREEAMALMNNQPEPMRENPYDRLLAQSMAEGAIGTPQAMPSPLSRPVDPLEEYKLEGRDRTFNPYDMIRPDNAPNT
jgi:hypothetical protein